MRVPFSDSAVATVDQQFTLLISSNVACAIDCFCLGIMDGGRTVIAFAADCPTIFVRYNVLILTHITVL